MKTEKEIIKIIKKHIYVIESMEKDYEKENDSYSQALVRGSLIALKDIIKEIEENGRR